MYDTVTLTMLYLKFLNNNDSAEFSEIKHNSSVIFYRKNYAIWSKQIH